MGEENYNGVADALASVEYIHRRRAQQRPPLTPLESLTGPGAVVLAFPERQAPRPVPESSDLDPGTGAMVGVSLGLLMWSAIFLTRCSLAWLFS